jgi:hypothetical protein
MRKLKRSIARANMKRAGIQHINKKKPGRNPITGTLVILPSFFAEHWREYI